MKNKAKNQFFSVGKVAGIVEVAPHTIRFWQQQFPQIQAKIGNGNRKYYNQDAIDLFIKIKHLMYDKGLKIAGIQKILLSEKFDHLFTFDDQVEEKEHLDMDLLSWADENDRIGASMQKLSDDTSAIDIDEEVRRIKSLLVKIK